MNLRLLYFVPFWLCWNTAAAAKLLQSCPTPCDPIDGSPPGSPVPETLQARALEWVAISFSNAWKWKVKVKSLSSVQLFTTPWTAAYQASPSFPGKSTGVGCHCLLRRLRLVVVNSLHVKSQIAFQILHSREIQLLSWFSESKCPSIHLSLKTEWESARERPNSDATWLLAQMQRICLQCRRPRFKPWVGRIPWRREWQPTPIFLPGEIHGQRSLLG